MYYSPTQARLWSLNGENPGVPVEPWENVSFCFPFYILPCSFFLTYFFYLLLWWMQTQVRLWLKSVHETPATDSTDTTAK